MSVFDDMDQVVAKHLPELIRVGQITYSTSPLNGPPERRNLGIHTPTADFEMLVFEDGWVELPYGTAADPHFEGAEVASLEEIEAQLLRLLKIARVWRPSGGEAHVP